MPAGWSLQDGYLIGPAANLEDAVLAGVDLAGVDLAYADVTGADLAGADLAGGDLQTAELAQTDLANSDLENADMNGTDLVGATLDGAAVTGATFVDAEWYDTTCPDGTNSNSHDYGCFTPLDTSPPVAHPSATGTRGRKGWFTSGSVYVTWDWTDSGPLSTSCAYGTPVRRNGVTTVTSSCTDLAGNIGHASFTLKIDDTRPKVTVTGVRNRRTYRTGHVPVAGCRTTDTISGVARPAKLSITTTGRSGLGKFTVTCAGAVSVAGTRQARTQRVTYTVIR
jgi:hypothetical protein